MFIELLFGIKRSPEGVFGVFCLPGVFLLGDLVGVLFVLRLTSLFGVEVFAERAISSSALRCHLGCGPVLIALSKRIISFISVSKLK